MLNTDEIIKGNALIEEFMGLPPNSGIEFHTSLDSLAPVMDKLEMYKSGDVDMIRINSNVPEIDVHTIHGGVLMARFEHPISTIQLHQGVWKCIVELIEWLKSQ